MNARFNDEADVLTQHGAVRGGIAIQTNAGLLVPVLRDAPSRDLCRNAGELSHLAQAVHDGVVHGWPMMNLSSSFNHRLVDGATAAAVVQCLRELLEHPATLFIV